MSKKNTFEEVGYYTWMFEGSLMLSHIGTGLIIFIVIAFTLLPLWPMIARKVLWYISVTFLLLTFAFTTIRALLFLLLWMVGIEFWILPNFFDDSLPFMDSFKPIYSLESGSPGQMLYRIGTMFAMVAAGYYVYTQPTDWDVMMQTQQSFVDDLYAGKLLPDAAQTMKDTMQNARNGGRDNIYTRNMPKLDEILHTLDEEEKEAAAASQNQEDGEFDSEAPSASASATTATSRGRSSVDREEEAVEEVALEGEMDEEVDEDEDAASDMMDRMLDEE